MEKFFDYGTIKISYYAGNFNYETIDVSSNEESHKFGDSVILNNNLQEIGGYVFKGLKSTNLTIPSSVTKIDFNSFEGTDLKTITFDDYKNSNILNNKDNLKIFLKIFLKWEQFGEIEISEYDPDTITMHYHKTTVERIHNYSIDFFNVHAGREKKIVSNLDSIILKDGEEEIKIDLGRLSTIQRDSHIHIFGES